MIGTKIISGVDASRKEKLGPQTGNRVVAARLYYPAKVVDELPVKVDFAAGEMYQNAKFVNSEKHPLIVYNHGYGSYMEANNKLCCELAANGYIVVSVGHAYEASSLQLEDGEVIKLDNSVKNRQISPRAKGTLSAFKMKNTNGTYEEMYAAFNLFQQKYCSFLNERLPEWATDVQFIVEKLKEDYSDYIDFEKGIGITGHSFGGNLAYYMCMYYDEYICGVNIDGAIFGDYSGQTMKKPFLQICNPGNVSVVSKALLNTNAPVELEIFEGITHMGFTDMKFYVQSKMKMGRMPAQEMSDRLIALHMRFFENYMCIRTNQNKKETM